MQGAAKGQHTDESQQAEERAKQPRGAASSVKKNRFIAVSPARRPSYFILIRFIS